MNRSSCFALRPWLCALITLLSASTAIAGGPPVPDVDRLPPIVGDCFVVVSIAPTATDASGVHLTGTTSDPLVYSEASPGGVPHTIVWDYADDLGNHTTQTQQVFVLDTMPPVIESVGPPVDLSADGTCHSTAPDLTGDVVAHDNCTRAPAQTSFDMSMSDFSVISQTPGGQFPGGSVVRASVVLRIRPRDSSGNEVHLSVEHSLSGEVEMHVAPHTPGTPAQSFDMELVTLQAQLPPGDRDFDLLRIRAGDAFSMPSPGHTTLTQLPGGNWAVDSFFDITYRIDFVGHPGGPLSGHSGSTTGTIRMQTPGSGGGGGGGGCVVPDAGRTAAFPPTCDDGYLSLPDQPLLLDVGVAVTQLLDGTCSLQNIMPLGPGTPGGSLGGTQHPFLAVLSMELTGYDDFAGYTRTLAIPVQCVADRAPVNPGQAIQELDIDMHSMEGQINGDPDFDLLRITAGSGFGMPSPGHTTLTQLPGGNWAVDSFFDITYRVEFIGHPGSILTGHQGSTTATIRMSSGGGGGGGGCEAPDAGGTAQFPADCDLDGDGFIRLNGLPPGIPIEGTLDMTVGPVTSTPGGTLGGFVHHAVDGTMELEMTGPGGASQLHRFVTIPVEMLIHSSLPSPFGSPTLSVDLDLFRMQGAIPPGDPDFDLLRIISGTGFGMRSPGHTTLTQLPGGNWAVDSFFDITYRIDFIGKPGGSLGGMHGSTTGTIRLRAPDCETPVIDRGGIFPPECVWRQDQGAIVELETGSDSVLVVTQTPLPGTVLAAGVYQFELVVTDNIGLSSPPAMVQVSVVDTTPPVLTAPLVDQTLPADETCSATLADLRSLVHATDNCDTDLDITQTPPPATLLGPGDHVVEFGIADDSLNQLFASLTVHVVDTSPPTVVTHPLQVTLSATCSASTTVDQVVTVASDNCPGSLTLDFAPDCLIAGTASLQWDSDDLGPHTLSVRARDQAGNCGLATVVVTVVDNTPPVITCPSPGASVLCGQAALPAVTGSATATDACDATPSITFSDSLVGGCPGTITRTWTATDDSGNSSSCDQIIPILPPPTGGTLTLLPGPGADCVQPGSTFTVKLRMSSLGLFQAASFSAFLSFDLTKLQLVSGSYTAAPFGSPTVSPIVAVGGSIHLGAQISSGGGQTPTTSDADLVVLTFMGTGQTCSTNVSFDMTQPTPAAIISQIQIALAPLALVGSPPIAIDGTPPVITGCPPDRSVHSDPGASSATFPAAMLTPSATDTCDSTPTMAFVRSDGAAAVNAPFPCGQTTTVTWTVTDDCGNASSCTFHVSVDCFNQVLADVTLSPTIASGTMSRCITFEFFDCNGTTPDATINQVITFNSGQATNVSVLVPAGLPYSCVTARDRRHTLRRSATLSVTGSPGGAHYVAPFTGGDQLVGGNLNDDLFIDILDFGGFIGQIGTSYGSPNTTCTTLFPHADFNGDGIVSLLDFTFIQIHFLLLAEANCCVVGPIMAAGDGPVQRITVAELHRRGLGQLAVADLNHDGVLDQLDVAAFMGGALPGGHHFVGAPAAAPGLPGAPGPARPSWFDPANWSAAGLPDETADVTLYTGVTIDQDGAVAHAITVAEGGALIINDGSLTARSLTIESGGTLALYDPASLLAVNSVTIEPGAIVVWRNGAIVGDVFNAGQMSLAPTPGIPGNTLRLDGNFTQHASGLLAIQLAAAADVLTILGDASLGGSLSVSLGEGLVTKPGDIFGLISARAVLFAFNSVTLPVPGAGSFDASFSDAAVTLIVVSPSGVIGDLDGNGAVNSLDLGIILAAWGTCDPCAADLDHNGVVNNLDLGILLSQWQQ